MDVGADAFPHDSPAFAQLGDGRLLLAGGSASLGIPAYDQIELYNPVSGTFAAAGNTVRFRTASGAAQLTGGKVLMAGAWWTHNDANTVGELYDPATATSTATGPLILPRSAPVVFPTSDGNAVVVGGINPTGSVIPPTPEIYSVADNTFTKIGNELFNDDPGWLYAPGFFGVQAVQDFRLSDGRYLALMTRPQTAVTEQALFTFDPTAKTFARFATTPPLPDTGTEVIAFPPQLDMIAKRAYLFSYDPIATQPLRAAIRAVDLATGVTTKLPGVVEFPADFSIAGMTITLLPNGRLLLAGGATPGNGNFGARANSFLITIGSSPPTVALALHAAVTVNGDIGSNYAVEYATALAPNQWQALTTLTLTNASQTVYDPTPIDAAARRFYRARLAP